MFPLQRQTKNSPGAKSEWNEREYPAIEGMRFASRTSLLISRERGKRWIRIAILQNKVVFFQKPPIENYEFELMFVVRRQGQRAVSPAANGM